MSMMEFVVVLLFDIVFFLCIHFLKFAQKKKKTLRDYHLACIR